MRIKIVGGAFAERQASDPRAQGPPAEPRQHGDRRQVPAALHAGTTEAPTVTAGGRRARPSSTNADRGDRKLRQEHEPNPRKANSADMSDMTRRNAAGGLVRRLRRPRLLTYVSVAALAAAVFVASGSATRGPSLAQPVGLQSFMPANSTSAHRRRAAGCRVLDRTPSFAWQPVRGATRYEFQLSTSDQFRAGNGLVWSSRTLTTPATTIPLSLPWITGDPASLYWRVRAVGGGSVSAWSDASAVHDALVERADGVAADERVAGRRARATSAGTPSTVPPATRSGSSTRTR